MRCLRIHTLVEDVRVHLVDGSLDGAPVPRDFQSLVGRLQEELGVCGGPRGIRWHCNSTNGLQELREAKELLLKREGLFVDAPDEAPGVFPEEHNGHLAPHGLSLIGPVLLPSQGLVLCNIEDR